MPKPVIVFGAGSYALTAAEYLKEAGTKIECFVVDDARYKVDNALVASLDDITRDFPPRYFDAVVGIGYSKLNQNRVRKYEQLSNLGYDLVSFSASKVRGRMGRGCFVFEDNTIQPFTEIGDYCVLWSGNHIGHHSKIGKGCFLTSHVVISGNCTIGDRCFIGVNATINDGLTIGEGSIVQSGSVVTIGMPPNSLWTREGYSKIPANRVKL